MGATELINYLDSRAKEYHRGTVRYKVVVLLRRIISSGLLPVANPAR